MEPKKREKTHCTCITVDERRSVEGEERTKFCPGVHVGGRGVEPASKTLALFMTKICDFPYPVCEL